MKRLLVICDTFPPAFAPRIGNLCKNLGNDYAITVITEKSATALWPIDFEGKNVELYAFDLSCRTKVGNALHKAGDYLFCLRDRRLYHKALRVVQHQQFDVVLCASFYIFSLLCGQKIAQKLHIPLVVDLRDIVEQYAQPVGLERVTQFFKLRWLNCWRRNRVLRVADVVTTVSPWHVDVLKRYNRNARLIYNGFDVEKFTFQPIKSDKFAITYTGRVLDLSMRNPLLLFEAVQQLCNDTKFAHNVQLLWYLDAESQQQIAALTEKYNLKHCTQIYSTISADQMPQIINASSIAVVLTNKSTDNGPHGVLTTKFFEALGCEKPVLCVRSDESCLADVIRQTHAGIAATTVDEVKQFILEKYAEWQQNGYTHQFVNQQERLCFTRQYQAKQFAEIFEQCSL